jgi:beta-lactamase regulating signal transducer with metallopeptidase domain
VSVFDHLWQSTLVAVVVAALTLLFRKQSARVRYRLWLAASLKFLLPFSLLVALGRMALVQPVPAESFALLTRIRPVAMPFSAVAPAPEHLPWLMLVIIVWALGAAAIASTWLSRWHRLSVIARGGQTLPFDLPVPVRMTSALMEPGLVGIRRPVILLPEGIFQQLSRSEIDTILRHELCHHARRDNLMAAMHMLVVAIFWFHPLVWFIGARLVEEREAACDESVLEGGQNPLEYAQAILRVCRLYLRSPLACASGVAGADLGRRVDAIMAGPDLEDVDIPRKLMLGGLMLIAIAGPLVTGGLRSAPPAELMQRLATALLPPAPGVTPSTTAMSGTTRHRAHPAVQAEPALKVEARTLREREIPATPSLIVIAAPQLPADPQQDEAKVCRAPQQLSGSRLLGPEVCLTQAEWDQIKKRDLILMPDGQTLAQNYDAARARSVGSCSPRPFGAAANTVAYAGSCF